MVDNLTVYGERPITELFATLASDEHLRDLMDNVVTLNGKRLGVGPDSLIEEVFIEAPLGKRYGYADIILVTPDYFLIFEIKPDSIGKVGERLGKQLPRYYAAMMAEETRSKSELIRRIFNLKNKRKSFLVSVTRDNSFPLSLKELYGRIDGLDKEKVGWADYAIISGMMESFGYCINGLLPNIWSSSKIQTSSSTRTD